MRHEQRAEFERFFGAQYDGLLRCVTLATGSREMAADCAQEAFARLYARWPKVSRYERPDIWIRTVALRLARRASKRRAAETSLEDSGEAVAQQPPGPDPDLKRAVAALPRSQRIAIVLHYYEDLPVEEIGRVLECATATAKVHLHRGRARLAELLHAEVDHVS